MILKVSKNSQSASASKYAQYLADWECFTIIASVYISPKKMLFYAFQIKFYFNIINS